MPPALAHRQAAVGCVVIIGGGEFEVVAVPLRTRVQVWIGSQGSIATSLELWRAAMKTGWKCRVHMQHQKVGVGRLGWCGSPSKT